MKTIRQFVLLSAVTFVLLACAANGEDPVDNARRITGTVEAWPLGSAELVARIDISSYASSYLDTIETASTRLATGSISAAGEIDLTLPATVSSDLVSSLDVVLGGEPGCASVTPGDARFTSLLVDLSVEQGGGAVAGLRRAESTLYGEQVIGRIYATRAAQITGRCESSSTDTDTHWELELDLRQGWNVLLATYTEASPGVVEAALQADAVPTEVAWDVELIGE